MLRRALLASGVFLACVALWLASAVASGDISAPQDLGLESAAPSQQSAEMARPTAVVRAEVAEFSIPVASRRRWRWARRETARNASEYRWEVEVTSGAETYTFGFSLFKFRGAKETVGSLAELLAAGQASVWRMDESGGVLVKDALVSVSAAPAAILIRVDDPATLRLLLRHRPPTAIVVANTPDTSQVSGPVPISYLDGPTQQP